jgi:hypothetical protein
MSGFELKPRRDYAAPAYPSPERPAPGRAPMIANALRPFAPLAFLVVGAVPPSHASHALTTLSPSPPPTLSQSSDKRVQRLSETEIDALIAGLKQVQDERPPAVPGTPAPPASSFLTEAEARTLLAAFLKKNGLEAKPARVSRAGAEFEADTALVEVRGAKADSSNYSFAYDEADLGDDELDELRLLRARGDTRLVVLDGRAYEYDRQGFFRGTLPDKRGVVRKLLADLERLLEQTR